VTWRPLPTPDGPPPDPVTVGRSLERLVASLGGPDTGALAAVFAGWDALVGPGVADHARPVSLVEGTLVVAVDQPGWATQLRFLEADLLARLHGAGGAVVRRIEVRVRGEAGPSAPRGGTGSRRGDAPRW
jgi:predicted nucleic acid-binding Zn ribbon protein